MLEHVTATRYVLPLREGGSLPGVVEADDLGTYVVKFTGAGQGVKVLVAEVIVGEIGAALGLPIPRLVTVEMPPAMARYEADEEVQDLLNASPGMNLGIDLLPGSLGYDGSRPPSAELAANILWLDAFTANIDRTWSNPNLLLWHRDVWAIDHGAALYFHHGWPHKQPNPERFARQPFRAQEHVLVEIAGNVNDANERLSATLTTEVLTAALAKVPTEWLETTPFLPDVASVRAQYLEHLQSRLASATSWLPARGQR